jgi:hypothetical protein
LAVVLATCFTLAIWSLKSIERISEVFEYLFLFLVYKPAGFKAMQR